MADEEVDVWRIQLHERRTIRFLRTLLSAEELFCPGLGCLPSMLRLEKCFQAGLHFGGEGLALFTLNFVQRGAEFGDIEPVVNSNIITGLLDVLPHGNDGVPKWLILDPHGFGGSKIESGNSGVGIQSKLAGERLDGSLPHDRFGVVLFMSPAGSRDDVAVRSCHDIVIFSFRVLTAGEGAPGVFAGPLVRIALMRPCPPAFISRAVVHLGYLLAPSSSDLLRCQAAHFPSVVSFEIADASVLISPDLCPMFDD